MGSLSDILGFEKVNLSKMWDQIEDDPERLFLGAADPFGTELWGGITGQDWEPIVNQWGGATDKVDEMYAAQGGDPSAGRGMHDIAEVIAGLFAGGYGLSQLGGGASAAGGGGTSGGTSSGLSTVNVPSSASRMPVQGGSNVVLPGSGSPAVQPASEGLAQMPSLSGGGSSGQNWLDRLNNMSSNSMSGQQGWGPQQQQQQPLQKQDILSDRNRNRGILQQESTPALYSRTPAEGEAVGNRPFSGFSSPEPTNVFNNNRSRIMGEILRNRNK